MGPRFRGDDPSRGDDGGEETMTTSNTKFRTGSKEAPTEPFKRAVTACLRAIAKKPELEVTSAAERPGLAPGKARLPEPARKMTRRDAAIVRGHADSIALKLACHDPKVHRKLMPGNPQARGVFEAVEQARVEALGSRRVAGGCEKSPRDARRSFPSRQVRRDHRPRRRAAVGRAGDAGARTPDRARAARGRPQDGRSVASAAGRQDRRAGRPAPSPRRGAGETLPRAAR